jgi:peptide/nickel transport system substrate-binding protein
VDPDAWAGQPWEKVLANVYDPIFTFKLLAPEELGIENAIRLDGVANLYAPLDEGVEGLFFNSWEISPDFKTFTLHVNPDLESTRGNPATAEDWVWREQRGWATVGSAQQFLINVAGTPDISDIKAIDDMTVQMYAPNGSGVFFFKILTVIENMAIDVKGLRDDGCITDDDPWATKCLAHQDYGFGPYTITEFTPGSQIVMEANPNYPRPLAFKRVIYREVPESSQRLALLVAGEADLSDEQTLVEEKSLLEGSGEASYAGMNQGSKWAALWMARQFGAFATDDCVRAAGYAIPYEQVHQVAFEGFGAIAHEAIAPLYGTNTNSQDWPYSYDPEKAAQLWESGNCPASFTLSWDSAITEFQALGTIIKSEFAKFGVDVVLDPLPSSAFTSRENNYTMEAFLEEQSAFVPDAGYAVWLCWHKDSFANFEQFKDDEVSAWIDQVMLLRDGPERQKILYDVQKAIMDRGGKHNILWLGYHLAANKHLAGLTWYPDSMIRYRDLKWVP